MSACNYNINRNYVKQFSIVNYQTCDAHDIKSVMYTILST